MNLYKVKTLSGYRFYITGKTMNIALEKAQAESSSSVIGIYLIEENVK